MVRQRVHAWWREKLEIFQVSGLCWRYSIFIRNASIIKAFKKDHLGDIYFFT